MNDEWDKHQWKAGCSSSNAGAVKEDWLFCIFDLTFYWFSGFGSEVKNKNKNKVIEMLELYISNKYC